MFIYIYKYALRSTAWQLTKFRAQETKIMNKLITIGEKETPFALKNSSVFSVFVVVVVAVVVVLL